MSSLRAFKSSPQNTLNQFCPPTSPRRENSSGDFQESPATASNGFLILWFFTKPLLVYSLWYQLRVYFQDSRGMNLLSRSLQISSVHTLSSWFNLILTSHFISTAMKIMACLWAFQDERWLLRHGLRHISHGQLDPMASDMFPCYVKWLKLPLGSTKPRVTHHLYVSRVGSVHLQVHRTQHLSI